MNLMSNNLNIHHQMELLLAHDSIFNNCQDGTEQWTTEPH